MTAYSMEQPIQCFVRRSLFLIITFGIVNKTKLRNLKRFVRYHKLGNRKKQAQTNEPARINSVGIVKTVTLSFYV